ncbi:glutamate receptor 3.3 [Selaginella moellendorffii]|nr:glutamate receptor 3.3 [Selaginella moellendorffii]|eukprot:XP_002963727.2 glutamate receptor 3.3 [Selaginella moellendorffii]
MRWEIWRCWRHFSPCEEIFRAMGAVVFRLALLLVVVLGSLSDLAEWPASVKIGTLLALNSTAGHTGMVAIQMAVDDINIRNSSFLNGTKLEIITANSNCSAFQGAASAMRLFEQNVVAIAGPQASVVAHFVAHMAAATQVPLVSASATDPTLSEYQFPFFLRLARSDRMQMEAVAGIISVYGWREVVAIYSDDDFGTNGVDTLGDALVGFGASIVFKAALDPAIDRTGISKILAGLAQMGTRIFVVHLQPAMGLTLFSEAYLLRMLDKGYVWIATEAIISTLDTIYLESNYVQATQGVIGTRSYVPKSPQLEAFATRWKKIAEEDGSGLIYSQYNAYDLYAYDSIWMIAYAVRKFLLNRGNFSFVSPTGFQANSGGGSDLAKLKILLEGQALLQDFLETSFEGVSGLVQLDKRGDPSDSAFQIVNMVGKGLRTVGYWTNATGCSTVEPGTNGSIKSDEQKLEDVIWPGGAVRVPRGWMVPKNGRPLVIGVPNKQGYKEFVDTALGPDNATVFHGFCIDVFQAALSYLPYTVPYSFQLYGNGTSTPSYDELVQKVVNKEYDAVVGDITITTKRAKIVDFTQPYTTSGLVVVVPLKKGATNHAWAFMRPFTPAMWFTTGAFFLFTGVVMWLLEHKKNRDFRGRPKKQVVTTLWFSFSTLFFAQREDVKSTLGRAVLIIWLFVVLIINSSYTASLTSILTVQQLMPTIQNIAGLVASNVPIGYQAGSFVEEYLLQLNVPRDRLVPLDSLSAYTAALQKGPKSGGVGAIVDELPYVQLFLSSECDFTIAGQQFTKSGWGFAFQKGSQLAIDMSTAILTLAENGELQRIHDTWLNGYDCGSQKVQIDSNELGLGTFWGLFLITGTASIICLFVYYTKMLLRYRRILKAQKEECSSPDNSIQDNSRRSSSFLRSFVTYVEESEVPKKHRNSSLKKKEGGGTGSSRREEDRSPDTNSGCSSSEAA